MEETIIQAIVKARATQVKQKKINRSVDLEGVFFIKNASCVKEPSPVIYFLLFLNSRSSAWEFDSYPFT